MKNTCNACGTVFEDPRKRRRRNPFCSPLCATAQAMTERLLGNAIIQVNQSSVKCLLCSKEVRSAGSHFARVHGIRTSNRLSERQEAYGIPSGARVEPEDILEQKSKRAREGHYQEFIGPRPHMRARGKFGHPGQSAAQRLHLTKFIEAGRLHGIESMKPPRVCLTCGRLFRNTRGQKRNQRYCSNKCKPLTGRAIETLKNNARKAHDAAVARNTIYCKCCKRPFLPASRPGRGVQVCSAKCREIQKKVKAAV
jgi:hypothetical protein